MAWHTPAANPGLCGNLFPLFAVLRISHVLVFFLLADSEHPGQPFRNRLIQKLLVLRRLHPLVYIVAIRLVLDPLQ